MIKFQVPYHTIAAEGRASFKLVKMYWHESNENPSNVCLNFFEQMTYVANVRIDNHNENEAAKEAPFKPRAVQCTKA